MARSTKGRRLPESAGPAGIYRRPLRALLRAREAEAFRAPFFFAPAAFFRGAAFFALFFAAFLPAFRAAAFLATGLAAGFALAFLGAAASRERGAGRARAPRAKNSSGASCGPLKSQDEPQDFFSPSAGRIWCGRRRQSGALLRHHVAQPWRIWL